MKNFTSVTDVADLPALLRAAQQCKADPFANPALGKNKTLGLIFLNPSLRTRLSSQKAAQNLGMQAMVMNIDKEGWGLEFGDEIVMNGTTVEHVKEAAAVMGRYFDVLGIRSFPKLQDRQEDYSEEILRKFMQYAQIPVMSLESATRHPLQSLADLLTITEFAPPGRQPKVVLSWAPHVKALPQAVPNSFAEWMNRADVEFVITHPEGYELHEGFSGNAPIVYDQDEALQDADFIYVKNWSSFQDYGKVLTQDPAWMLTNKRLDRLAPQAKVMHCLPVRRGVELGHDVLDGSRSLVVEEAANRVPATQAVLQTILHAQN